MSINYDEIAAKYDLSPTVVQHVAQAIALGNGQQAQFNDPELGGMGQWMPGMLMIGDAFNYTLKAKVDALCHELAQAFRDGDLRGFSTYQEMSQSKWWSLDLENPSISGGQNTLKYVYFREKHRLIVSLNQHETIYDTSPHIIIGVSQQQANNRMMLIFQTQSGQTMTVADFKRINSS